MLLSDHLSFHRWDQMRCKLVLHHWLSGTSEWGVVQKQSVWGLDPQASETRL